LVCVSLCRSPERTSRHWRGRRGRRAQRDLNRVAALLPPTSPLIRQGSWWIGGDGVGDGGDRSRVGGGGDVGGDGGDDGSEVGFRPVFGLYDRLHARVVATNILLSSQHCLNDECRLIETLRGHKRLAQSFRLLVVDLRILALGDLSYTFKEGLSHGQVVNGRLDGASAGGCGRGGRGRGCGSLGARSRGGNRVGGGSGDGGRGRVGGDGGFGDKGCDYGAEVRAGPILRIHQVSKIVDFQMSVHVSFSFKEELDGLSKLFETLGSQVRLALSIRLIAGDLGILAFGDLSNSPNKGCGLGHVFGGRVLVDRSLALGRAPDVAFGFGVGGSGVGIGGGCAVSEDIAGRSSSGSSGDGRGLGVGGGSGGGGGERGSARGSGGLSSGSTDGRSRGSVKGRSRGLGY
jgi:hypothetical protein